MHIPAAEQMLHFFLKPTAKCAIIKPERRCYREKQKELAPDFKCSIGGYYICDSELNNKVVSVQRPLTYGSTVT